VSDQKSINRNVDVFPIPDPVVQYLIYSDDGTEPAGYAVITARMVKNPITGKQIRESSLWHIQIQPKYRRQGYARCLIEALKGTFDEIFTQALTDESKKLLMNTGFIRKDQGNIKIFRWKKS
jgi:ribosomal protein S18 acetylase RimI-like enzyme